MNVFIKTLTVCMLVLSPSLTAERYHRLKRREKRIFLMTHKDLLWAYRNKNFTGFKIQGKNFIDTYDNVLIDPSCQEFRDKYYTIQGLLSSIDKTMQLNTLQRKIDSIADKTPAEEDLETYTKYLKLLKDNRCDSVFNSALKQYRGRLQEVYMAMGHTFESFQKICMYPFIGDEFYMDESKRFQKELHDEFVKLTAELDIQKIREFKHKYKGVFKEDIHNLEQRCRAKDRLSLLRSDEMTLDRIKDYYTYYPQEDAYLTKEIKKGYKRKILRTHNLDVFNEYRMLFKEYDDVYNAMERYIITRAINGSVEHCKVYLTTFPDGKYKEDVLEWIRTFYNASYDNDGNYY